MTPEILVVGHIARDITDDGWRAGGGVYYSAAQASRLGLRVAAVTVCSSDVEPSRFLPDVEWAVASDAETTTFENTYQGSHRSQRVTAQARPLTLDDIPPEWRETPVILIATLLHEVGAPLVQALAGRAGLLACTLQGWLRALDGDRVVRQAPQPSIWRESKLLFLSDEDLIDITTVLEAREPAQVVVLTRAGHGCSVWDDAGRHDLPALATEQVDPTGAGDVFSAAYTVRYHETGSSVEAARFASAAAALAVAGQGIDNVGDRGAIEARLAATVTP